MSFEDLQSSSGRSHVIAIHHQQRLEDPSRGIPVAIFRINTALAAFQRLVASLGTPKDTPDLRLKLSAMPSLIPSFSSFYPPFLSLLLLFLSSWISCSNCFYLFRCSHNSRLKIQQLVRETSDKLKQATEADRATQVSVSSLPGPLPPFQISRFSSLLPPPFPFSVQNLPILYLMLLYCLLSYMMNALYESSFCLDWTIVQFISGAQSKHLPLPCHRPPRKLLTSS